MESLYKKEIKLPDGRYRIIESEDHWGWYILEKWFIFWFRYGDRMFSRMSEAEEFLRNEFHEKGLRLRKRGSLYYLQRRTFFIWRDVRRDKQVLYFPNHKKAKEYDKQGI